MLQQIAIGSALLFVTTLIHAGSTIAALWALRAFHADRRARPCERGSSAGADVPRVVRIPKLDRLHHRLHLGSPTHPWIASNSCCWI